MNVRSIGKQAFDAIYESNLEYVYRTACYYTQNHYQAEEITQCVFIKLYDNIDNVNMQSVNFNNNKAHGIKLQKRLCTGNADR